MTPPPLDVLAARLRALPRRLRVTLCAAACVAAVAAAFVGTHARDTRVPLFAAPLRPEQVVEVEQRLAAWTIPSAAGADNVRVAAGKRGELLLRLALAGVPHAHLAGSEETLAHVGALTPQTVLEAQTRDALAGDLALALRGIDGVADARVVIAPSSAGVYADERRRDASASVRVTLAPGARLGARTVAGIAAFVAGGVPGLDAEHVTVLDDRGVALDAASADDAADVQSALQSALDAAFGSGSTIVRVHREPLGERRDVRDVRRAALDGSLARSVTDERYASAVKKYSKTGTTEDRGSETREEHRVAAAGATARLTVAIFVDRGRALDLAKIRRLAAATAGLRVERGDDLTVESVAFGAAPVAAAARTPGWLLTLASALPQAAGPAAIVLIAAFARKPLLAVAARAADAATVRTAARTAPEFPAARVHGALAGEPAHVAAAVISRLATPQAAAVLELYPPAERAAIVARLGRANASLVPHPDELLRDRG